MRLRLLATSCLAGAVLGLGLAASPAAAAIAHWTDWQSAGANSAEGTLLVGATSVDVTYSGLYAFVQTGAAGETNYWNPSAPYVSGTVGNAPPGTDIIALGAGGAKTITFSQAVVDPVLALVSWNGNVVDFATPIEILSEGTGYWGGGTMVLNGTGTGFTGNGEVHGVIRLPGTFTAISFTDTSEYWHGFTVGVLDLASPPTGVPEPASLALLGAGLLGLGIARRRRS